MASEREERVCEGAAEQRDRRVSVKCRQKGHGGWMADGYVYRVVFQRLQPGSAGKLLQRGH